MEALEIPNSAWLEILGDVFEVSIFDKLDSIDIAWHGLSAAIETLDERDVLILKLRYVDGLTLEESGRRIPRKDKLKGPITREIARQIESNAIRKLKHPSRMRVIKSCIAGWWNLRVARRLTRGWSVKAAVTAPLLQ